MAIQNDLNARSGSGWDIATFLNRGEYDFPAAILVEAAEGVAHTDYKWWSPAGVDLNQYRMELIDIVLFLTSETILVGRTLSEQIACNCVINAFNTSITKECPQDISLSRKELSYLVHHVTGIHVFLDALHPSDMLAPDSLYALEADHVVQLLTKAWTHIFRAFWYTQDDGSFDNILNDYLGKAVLHKFRVSNGYKTVGVVHDFNMWKSSYEAGENVPYLKNWNGQEDNEVLRELCDKLIAAGTLSMETLMLGIQEAYNAVTTDLLRV